MAYFIDFYFDLHIYDPLTKSSLQNQTCLLTIPGSNWNVELDDIHILINCHLDARARQIQLTVADNWEVSL